MCNRNTSLHQENTQKPLPGFLPSKHNQAWHNAASETSWIGHIQSGMAKDWQQSWSDQCAWGDEPAEGGTELGYSYTQMGTYFNSPTTSLPNDPPEIQLHIGEHTLASYL